MDEACFQIDEEGGFYGPKKGVYSNWTGDCAVLWPLRTDDCDVTGKAGAVQALDERRAHAIEQRDDEQADVGGRRPHVDGEEGEQNEDAQASNKL
jgi:hypothetical protein